MSIIASMMGRDGAAKAQPPQPSAPAVMPQRDPREIHPAAVEAAVKWSQMWDHNDRLTADNERMRNELEILERVNREKDDIIESLRDVVTETQRNTDQRVEILETHYLERLAKAETHYLERLAKAESDKERYLRYAVDFSGRLRSCGEQITTALNSCAEQITGMHRAAMEMARAEAMEMPQAATERADAEKQLPKAATLEPHDIDQSFQNETHRTGDRADNAHG